MMCPI